MLTTHGGVIATGRKEERGGKSYKREGLWHCVPSFSRAFHAAAPKHDLPDFLPGFTHSPTPGLSRVEGVSPAFALAKSCMRARAPAILGSREVWTAGSNPTIDRPNVKGFDKLVWSNHRCRKLPGRTEPQRFVPGWRSYGLKVICRIINRAIFSILVFLFPEWVFHMWYNILN